MKNKDQEDKLNCGRKVTCYQSPPGVRGLSDYAVPEAKLVPQRNCPQPTSLASPVV